MDNFMAKSDNGKICAILSYLLIGIIWYFVDKGMQKDERVKFHVKQGIILLIFSIIWSVVLNFLFGFLIMGLMSFIWGMWHLLSYVPLIFTIIGIINAVNDNQKELPVIGHYAEKLTF